MLGVYSISGSCGKEYIGEACRLIGQVSRNTLVTKIINEWKYQHQRTCIVIVCNVSKNGCQKVREHNRLPRKSDKGDYTVHEIPQSFQKSYTSEISQYKSGRLVIPRGEDVSFETRGSDISVGSRQYIQCSQQPFIKAYV